MSTETRQFQTEVQEILNLMIHSLYSNREIFLRELVSNASDALDKIRYEEIVNKDFKTDPTEKHIRLTADKENKSLTISDNGIGMSYDEVVQNIGTIAYSGSKNFAKKISEMKDSPELIGQFGVGFYSSFMVAHKVRLHTQKAGSDEGIIWESTGDGSYTIEKASRKEGHGTSVTLFLREEAADKEENGIAQNFCDQWTLKSLIKKYSDFIEYPVRMEMEKHEPELDSEGKALEGKTKVSREDEVLNSQKALWLKSPKDISEEEYKEFYKHVTSDWNEPQDHIHFKAEGTQEFSSIMYIPKTLPFDYNQRDMKYGLSLYVRRVFILDNCEQLLPQYLRFLKGVVDSSDLPLNVSREMIQQDKQILAIRKAIVSKALRHLEGMLKDKREDYENVWKNFGSTLKEGLASDYSNKEKLQDLCLFHSSHSDKLTTLKEYVERMPSGQKDIYYVTGDSVKNLESSPHLEKLKQKNYEVIYMTDPVDEWVMSSVHDYNDKKMVSITRDDLELDTEEEKKQKEEEKKNHAERLKSVTEAIQKALSENIREVRLSDRLVDSPACLISGKHDPSAHMERLMESMGHSAPKSKRILEINPEHPVFAKMLEFEDKRKADWAEILYNQALLNEGSPPENPARFSRQISELMLQG
ncbi:MAG: molecular chaperone HtpG [Deltaproteobacteria bacterium]|nr:molecular chaperone HtpG [Deltaproteobacteria bacterium]